MWLSFRFLRITKRKAFFLFWGITMSCLFSSHANASDSTSTCWVYGGIVGGNANLPGIGIELSPPSWPDPQTALMAFAQSALQRLQNADYDCYVQVQPNFFILKGKVSQLGEPGEISPSRFRSGPVNDPLTGTTVGYQQGFGFNNAAGEYCSVGVRFETVDGDYYGRAQCLQHYIVKLSPLTGIAESGTTLVSVEPGMTTETLIAMVYDKNGQLVPNARVKLAVDVQPYSGSHQHDEGRHSNSLSENRAGKLAPYPGTTATISDNGKVLEGNTGQVGLRFTFTAPAPAGDHKITASCTDGKNCTPEGPDTVWVGYKGLQPVGDSAVYRLIPNAAKDPGHPDNHYLTLTAASRLTVLATLYRAKYPDLAVLHLNDASLERGGIFDLSHNWKSPHFEHCRGAVIDVRANGAEGALDITSQTDPMIIRFQELTRITGASALWDIPKDKNKKRRWELRHFHIQLMGQEGLQCP